MSSCNERNRDEIMSHTMNNETSQNIVRMGPLVFLRLAEMLE